MLLIVLISRRRILSMSSLPTIVPINPRLFTGVGPTRTVSPIFRLLMFPNTFIAASHSPGCVMLVNSIFATEASSSFLSFLKMGTFALLSVNEIFNV